MDETSGDQKRQLSVNDMWQVVKGADNNWGVEGYEVPKQYIDAKQIKWEREREKLLNGHDSKWPPSDWPKVKKPGENVVVEPKRKNFLDEIVKWSNSFYDEEKAKTVMQELRDKNRPIDAPRPPPEMDKNKRKQFLEYEEEKKKRRAEYSDYPKYDDKIRWIEKAKERIQAFNEKNKKDKITLIKEKYSKNGSLPKCDKITVVSDALHCGEKIPFYKTYVKDGDNEGSDDEGKNKNKKEKPLFFPSKTYTWTSAPKWSYPKKKTEARPKAEESKSDEDGDKKKIEPIDIRKSFYNVTHHGQLRADSTRVNYYFSKPYDFNAKGEQYKTWKEINPKNFPGPQQYWKTLPLSKQKKKKKGGEDEEPQQVEGQPKVYLINREKTDKRLYKPMKSHIF